MTKDIKLELLISKMKLSGPKNPHKNVSLCFDQVNIEKVCGGWPISHWGPTQPSLAMGFMSCPTTKNTPSGTGGTTLFFFKLAPANFCDNFSRPALIWQMLPRDASGALFLFKISSVVSLMTSFFPSFRASDRRQVLCKFGRAKIARPTRNAIRRQSQVHRGATSSPTTKSERTNLIVLNV